MLRPGEAEAFHTVTQRNVVAKLDRDPPAGLLLGSEKQAFPWAPAGLDGQLADWARAHGYTPYPAPSGRLTLWVRP